MKNKVLFALVMILGAFATSHGQNTVPNNGFEGWFTTTNYLSLTLTNPVTYDTAITANPDGWTTSNEVTGGKIFHGKRLVTQSSNAHSGTSSIRLMSDSVTASLTGVPVVGTLTLNFVCPGFAVCGTFPINLSAFASLGSTFNPALLSGAGTRVSGRLAKIGGYVQYSPVGGDTAYIVAVLRKGGTVVAEAKYLRWSTDPGFVYFEAPFVYQNCLEPDTLVYTLSSGNPYGVSNVIAHTPTGLHIGSSLYADSLFVIDTVAGFTLPPLVANDSAHTLAGTPVGVLVSINDINCYGSTEAVTVSAQPAHGTATVSGDSIIYTPNAGFVGTDTFYYTATVGSSSPSSPGRGTVRVSPHVGVIEISEGQTRLYPNPASNKLHITTSNTAITTANIYDLIGSLVKTEAISSNTTIDLTSFNEGLYLVRFTGSEGKVLGSSRFSVVK